jgi:predicted phage terminase large subunit-like protein
VFDSLYQQNPKPVEGLMYENPFKEYDVLPATRIRRIRNYTDTADTGTDYLCSITYAETETGNFILDVMYTQKAMEYTEPKTAEMLTRHRVELSIVESNNGGRGFARNVESQCRMMGNAKTRFKWFHQAENKQVRIFTKSADVQNLTLFPRGWAHMWPDFHSAVTGYMKTGKNAHDDAPEALTGTVEWRKKGGAQDLSGYFT